jgi:hypothetical protein
MQNQGMRKQFARAAMEGTRKIGRPGKKMKRGCSRLKYEGNKIQAGGQANGQIALGREKGCIGRQD